MATDDDTTTTTEEPVETDEESGVFLLDVDQETGDVEDLTREALRSVEARGGAVDVLDVDDESIEEDGGPQAEIDQLKDRLVRTLADFDNLRKRAAREREEERRYGLAGLLTDFLAIVDNLERAIEAQGSLDDLKSGVEMIHRQMLDLLRQRGVEPVAAAGEPFDPHVHEAVMREDDAGVSVPTVTAELQRGYVLSDRLLRPAMVKVAMPEGDG